VVLLAIALGVAFAVRGATTAGTAPEVVSDYRNALAAGDSEAALAMLDSKPRQGAPVG
jgi:predicted Zn-dependent protease with MMP-like domain